MAFVKLPRAAGLEMTAITKSVQEGPCPRYQKLSLCDLY